MPKYCPDCGETKSKTSFVKGKIVCKDCDRDRLSSIAPSTVDGTISTPNTMDVICGAISKILERLDVLEERSQNISTKLDDLQQSIGSLRNTSHTDMLNTLQDVPKSLQSISSRLDVLEEVSSRLDTLQDISTRLDASNALRNLSSRLTPVHIAHVEEKPNSCSPM